MQEEFKQQIAADLTAQGIGRGVCLGPGPGGQLAALLGQPALLCATLGGRRDGGRAPR